MTWVRLFELQRYYSWIIDRFHISTRLYQQMTYGRDYDFTWLEQRLLPLGFRIVLCTRREETFETARAERLKVSGNPSQYDDLGIFIREQENIRRRTGESILPVFEVDVSEEDIDRAADQVADWMEQTGDRLLNRWTRPQILEGLTR